VRPFGVVPSHVQCDFTPHGLDAHRQEDPRASNASICRPTPRNDPSRFSITLLCTGPCPTPDQHAPSLAISKNVAARRLPHARAARAQTGGGIGVGDLLTSLW
jgi:hypothetical protein